MMAKHQQQWSTMYSLLSAAAAVTLTIVTVFTSPAAAAAAAAAIINITAYDSPKTRLQQDVCGVPPIKPDIGDSAENIVGGQEAIPHSWPWQVELLVYESFRCGGSILARRWIVTAAHCIVQDIPVDPDGLTIVVGQHDRWEAEPMKITVNVKSVHVHPNYTVFAGMEPLYDIALIELATEIPFNKYIQPVCLPTTDFTEGTMCAITGWGDEQSKRWKRQAGLGIPDTTDRLMEVAIPIYSQSDCVVNYHRVGLVINDHMICAGFPQGGKDACAHDSGGPLVCHGADGVWQLVGVSSWEDDCAKPTYPSVYTRVQLFNEWIKNIIK